MSAGVPVNSGGIATLQSRLGVASLALGIVALLLLIAAFALAWMFDVAATQRSFAGMFAGMCLLLGALCAMFGLVAGAVGAIHPLRRHGFAMGGIVSCTLFFAILWLR